MKMIEGDVGFAEDSFACMKQAVGNEEHYYNDFVSNPTKENMERYNNIRKVRSDLQDSIIKALNVRLQGQDWCKLKHTCGTAMHIQEMIARVSSFGLIEIATVFKEVHKFLYLEYLNLLKLNESNASIKTSA